MITVQHKGNFNKTTNFLKRMLDRNQLYRNLAYYAQQGVNSLESYTPRDTGYTANSWGYEIKIGENRSEIHWTNSSANKGIPIVILIQYGHATRSGTYISGIDFINPALRTVIEDIAEDVWREVTES